jgi:hypothetical protein
MKKAELRDDAIWGENMERATRQRGDLNEKGRKRKEKGKIKLNS